MQAVPPPAAAALVPDGVPRDAALAAGPSSEMRRFAASMRAIGALLCTVLLLSGPWQPGPVAAGALLAYGLWAGPQLRAESRHWRLAWPLLHY